MFTYYCNEYGCPGHIKSWERCRDRSLQERAAIGKSPLSSPLAAALRVPAWPLRRMKAC